MVFNSDIFVLFALLFFPIYFLAPSVKVQNGVALLGSYVFYGWWDWRFLFLIGFATVFNYWVAQRVTGPKGKAWVWTAVIVNLGILSVFKYFNFFVDSFVSLLAAFGFAASTSTLSIILPVGISFFTFQSMSYVLDVRRGRLAARFSLLQFATYIALFPQLVAGPIVRAARLLPQLTDKRRFRWANLWIGAEQVMIGLVMKIVIADRLAPIVDRTFDQPALDNAAVLVLGVVFFAFQIYCDFAGYSLIAIGLGRIMGLTFGVNFRRPYLALDFSDFWRRWHISLSSWLRDYLYISMGGNRGTALNTNRNLMVTMLLGGLWHGAAWTFVVWGGLHGLYLIAGRAVQRHLSPRPGFVLRWVRRLGVFAAVCVAWVFFRADSFQGAMDILSGIVLPQGFSPGRIGNKFEVAIGLTWIALLMLSEIAREDSARARTILLRRDVRLVKFACLALALTLFGVFDGGAFVYFQF